MKMFLQYFVRILYVFRRNGSQRAMSVCLTVTAKLRNTISRGFIFDGANHTGQHTGRTTRIEPRGFYVDFESIKMDGTTLEIPGLFVLWEWPVIQTSQEQSRKP